MSRIAGTTSARISKNLPGEQTKPHVVDVLRTLIAHNGMHRDDFACKINLGLWSRYVFSRKDENPTFSVLEHIAQHLDLTLWQLLAVEDLRGRPQDQSVGVRQRL